MRIHTKLYWGIFIVLTVMFMLFVKTANLMRDLNEQSQHTINQYKTENLASATAELGVYTFN